MSAADRLAPLLHASMRPRLFTAENRRRHAANSRRLSCFNEAAAFHRGEPTAGRQPATNRNLASMRPRLFTAENAQQTEATNGQDRLQ